MKNKTYKTQRGAVAAIRKGLSVNDLMETDNSGQIVIYTDLWKWQDGTIRNTPDPSWEDES